MNARELARKIDHTNLNPDASREDILKLCKEARQYNFRAVCVNPVWTGLCHEELRKRSDILVAVVVDFPLGQGGYNNKHFQAELARAKGADELDVVWNIGVFISGDYETVLDELKPLARVLPTKVIVETGCISQEKITPEARGLLKKAVELIGESGAFCIKTSTGVNKKFEVETKTKAKHVKIFRKADPALVIKAAGGIRTLEDAMLVINAGADIIGTSSGVKIMKEFLGGDQIAKS